jgi:hypothetical protein
MGEREPEAASSRLIPSRNLSELDVEYQYIVHVRAWETFLNIMRSERIAIPEGSHYVSFTCGKRLNMKAHKQNALIWSYSIIRVTKNEDVIEEG